MLKTRWTVTAAGLLALCMTGCGGGTDYAGKICDRLNSCGTLSQMAASNVAECKTMANAELKAIPAASRDQANKEIDACLALECTAATSCLQDLSGSIGTDYASKICDRVQACGFPTDVASCRTTANQKLSTIPASMKSQIDGCLALTCPEMMTCLDALGPSTTSAAPSGT